MSDRAKPTICRICKECCGLLVEGEGDGLRISGNPDHPISKGFICLRGKNFNEVHRSPERLRQPLLRKGSNHVPISWDEALDLLASQLQASRERYGAESVVFYKGESLKHQEVAQYMHHLSFGFGTPNFTTVGSLCHVSMAMAHGMTYGGIPLPDYDRMQTAILWGANPAAALQRSWSRLNQAVRSGARLIVIDPASTQASRLAHLHLQVRPGSDGFLALAFIKHGIETGHIQPQDTSVGKDWAHIETLVSGMPVGAMLEKTGIPPSQFLEACELISAHRPVWIQTGCGLELHPCGVQTIRAVAILQALLDPGLQVPDPPLALTALPRADSYPPRVDPIGRLEAPLYVAKGQEAQGMVWPRAILENDPYPVRSMLVVGSNPMRTFPDSALQAKAFKALDFMAVFDLFMTETAELADLVLPAADTLGCLELHDYCPTGESMFGLVQPVAPLEGTWPAWKLCFELARRLGLGHLFPWETNHEALAYRLSGTGVALEDLLRSPTSTCSYERAALERGPVHIYSEKLAAVGQSPLPLPECFTLPREPDAAFPLWLSTGDRVPFFQHSQFRQCESSLRGMPEPALDIHRETAGRMGIADGDWAVLSTCVGSIRVKARLSDDLRADCVRLTHGWNESNANALTSLSILDPISGFPWMRALPARVQREGA